MAHNPSILLLISPFCRHSVKCFYPPSPYGSAIGSVALPMIMIESEILPWLCNSDAVEATTLRRFGDRKHGFTFPYFDSILSVNAVSLVEPLPIHIPQGFIEKGERL